MPMELLKGSGDDLRGILLSMGVEIEPRCKAQLSQYIQSRYPKDKIICALNVGWHNNCFVLPDEVYGKNSHKIIYQSEEQNHNEYNCLGTLESWKSNISLKAENNPMLVIAISCAFAGAILKLCNSEGGGIHLVGNSSTGKTGLIEAACSVWGGDNYKRSWRSTANGMEGVLSMFNDGLLALDEISECDPKEVGSIVYSLTNGRDKQRASRKGNARDIRRWRCFILSNGERTIETTINESGKQIKAGQLTRLPSLTVERKFGVWDNIDGFESGASFTDYIKTQSKLNYGNAGRLFLERITYDERDFCKYLEEIKNLPEFQVNSNNGQAKRVASKFAIIALAGEIATEYDITGWTQGTAINAASVAFYIWQEENKANSSNKEQIQIVESISSFITKHGDSRFSNKNGEDNKPVNNRAGWYCKINDIKIYLFTKDGLREALKGQDYKRSLKILVELGILITDEPSNKSKTHRIDGTTIRLYEINPEKLEVNYEY